MRKCQRKRETEREREREREGWQRALVADAGR